MQLDEQQVKALARLQMDSSPDWQAFLGMIRAHRESVRSDLEMSTGLEQTAKLQGRAQMLSELISDIEQAPALVRQHY